MDELINNKILKKFNLILIVIFILLIFLPFVGMFFGINDEIDQTENRKLAELPNLSFNDFDFGDYADDMEKFLNDNFSFRNILVEWNQLIHVKWFNTAPVKGISIQDINGKKIIRMQRDVIMGRDGWYYYNKENLLDDYKGLIPLPDDQLLQIKNNLEEKRNWLKDQGINFVVMLSPNKSTIYPEYLPNNINKIYSQTRLDQVTDYMKSNSDVLIVDPRLALIDKKSAQQLYEKSGTHWNDYGAFIAYQELLNKLNELDNNLSPSNLSDYNIGTVITEGRDLAIILLIKKYIQEELVKLYKIEPSLAEDGRLLYDDPNPNPEMPLIAKELPNSDLPSAVMFRDSFSNALIPFISEHFSRISFVWTYEMLPHIIEIEKPDIVIYEFVERRIEDVLLGKITK